MPINDIISIILGIVFLMLAYKIAINDKKFIKFWGKIGLFNKKWQEFRGTYWLISWLLIFLIFGFILFLKGLGGIINKLTK